MMSARIQLWSASAPLANALHIVFRSFDLDFDLFRFGFFPLSYGHAERPILVICVDLIWIGE